MKVNELIKQLQKLDGNVEVLLLDDLAPTEYQQIDALELNEHDIHGKSVILYPKYSNMKGND